MLHPVNIEDSNADHYLIGAKIFETINSAIYLATNLEMRHKCAIKFFKKGKMSPESIQNEICIINEINSPYIVHINGVYKEISKEYGLSLEMPLAQSDAYEFFIKNGPKKEKIVSQVIFSVLNALQYLHGIGIIHRNISPENILVMGDDIAKKSFLLTGFSHATRFTPGQKFTDFNVGSSIYNSPEIHLKLQYDETTDLWSVGMLTYALLCRRLPFTEETEEEFFQSAKTRNISFHGLNISDSAKDFILSLLKFDPSERLSIRDALNHKWITKFGSILNEIRSFINLSEKIENHVEEKRESSKYYWEYRVREKSTNKIYSAKFFYENIENYEEEKREQFLRMIKDNLTIRHPVIISSYLFKERCSVLICELNELKPLKSINLNDLTDTRKLIIAYGISSGMSYLHGQGILHRELDISNVFVDEKFYPKLANVGMFGVVKSIYELSKIVKIPFSFPPEFYKLNEYTDKSEVFSFGILLYQLMSGKNPYENINIITHLANINEQKRPPIDESIPNAYGKLISKCLSDDPNERPTFSEICLELRKNHKIYKTDIDIWQYQKYIDFISLDQSSQNSIKKASSSDKSSETKEEETQKDDGSNDNNDQQRNEDYDNGEEEDDEEDDEEESGDEDDDIEIVEEVVSSKEKILEILKKNNVEFVDIKEYSLKRKLSLGSYGVVYESIKKAQQRKEREKLAAKIFNSNFFKFKIGSSIVMNFLREIIFLSKLSHPSIIKFKGYSPRNFKTRRDKNKHVMLTELAAKGSLNDIILKLRKNEKIDGFDNTNKLIIIYGIAVSMSHLHSHNIIHRDLKPENILVDKFYHPKLADFGLSIKLTSDTFAADECSGTVRFMAPEICADMKYSKASDVYAFGIIAYELMNESFVFENCNSLQIMYAICNKKYRPNIKKTVPSAYKKLIERCWAEDAEARPTFDEIVSSLKTDPEFINESIDKGKFQDYMQKIDEQFKTARTSEIIIKL